MQPTFYKSVVVNFPKIISREFNNNVVRKFSGQVGSTKRPYKSFGWTNFPSVVGFFWLSLCSARNWISLSTIRQITWLAFSYGVTNYSALAKQNLFHQFEYSRGNNSHFGFGNLSIVWLNWHRDRGEHIKPNHTLCQSINALDNPSPNCRWRTGVNTRIAERQVDPGKQIRFLPESHQDSVITIMASQLLTWPGNDALWSRALRSD